MSLVSLSDGNGGSYRPKLTTTDPMVTPTHPHTDVTSRDVVEVKDSLYGMRKDW